MSQPYGTGELLTSVIDDARRYAVDAELKQASAGGKWLPASLVRGGRSV